MEADSRAAQVDLDAVGIMVKNKRGTQIPNPLIFVIDTLERRHLSVSRSMSLNPTSYRHRTIKSTTKTESDNKAALKDIGPAGLIALPPFQSKNIVDTM